MKRSLSPEVASLLRCPLTRQPLRPATSGELSDFDADFPEGAWISGDGFLAYPVRDGFPILVPGEAVPRNAGERPGHCDAPADSD